MKKTIGGLCFLFALTGCTSETDTAPSVGTSITTVTPGVPKSESWEPGTVWDTVEEEPEESVIPVGTIEDYVSALDQGLLGLDSLNKEISTGLSRYQKNPEEVESLKESLLAIEQQLLLFCDLIPPEEFQYIQGEFALAAQDMSKSYGYLAQVLGTEVTPNTLLTLTGEIESQTAKFSQVSLTLLQGLNEA